MQYKGFTVHWKSGTQDTVDVYKDSKAGRIPNGTIWGERSMCAHATMVRALERAEAQSLRNCLVFSRAPDGRDGFVLQTVPRLRPSYSPKQADT